METHFAQIQGGDPDGTGLGWFANYQYYIKYHNLYFTFSAAELTILLLLRHVRHNLYLSFIIYNLQLTYLCNDTLPRGSVLLG